MAAKRIAAVAMVAAALCAETTARSFQYDEAGRLILAVYESGDALQYVYTRGDNIREVRRLTLPAAPGSLSVTRDFETRAKLFWADNSGDETGFAVQRRELEGSVWTTIGETTAGTTEFVDTSLSPTINYLYRIVALSASEDGFHSAFTDEVLASGEGSIAFSVVAFDDFDRANAIFALTFESSEALSYELLASPNLDPESWETHAWSATAQAEPSLGEIAGQEGQITIYLRIDLETTSYYKLRAIGVE